MSISIATLVRFLRPRTNSESAATAAEIAAAHEAAILLESDFRKILSFATNTTPADRASALRLETIRDICRARLDMGPNNRGPQ
jgi:hypothetical protein